MIVSGRVYPIYAGTMIDIPDAIVGDFIKNGIVYAPDGNKIENKNLGRAKETKDAVTKTGKRSRGRPRKSK